MTNPTTTLAQQIRSVGRELGMRRSTYAKWVANGRMTQAEADHEIACMADVYALLKAFKAQEDEALG